MKPTTRNRLLALGALLVAAAGLAFVSLGKIGDNLVYYWSPSEMLAKGEDAYGATVRLGGLVQPGSIHWDETHTSLTFRVAQGLEPSAASVLVRSTEVPPQMFRERIGVVVEGTYDASHVFSSNRLMVNHSNEYRAPKNSDDVKKLYQTLEPEKTASNGAPGEGISGGPGGKP
ncbi:cytochrome c maturation protein CcmE [Aggregicoccus sp. 17bor-14]|uniref:cytochrome c maturation protein CcmE n=1 Tax=Myxococcaceae TaxID=31 RepID=UPI00129C59CB|nr:MULTISPECIES: cytochrome c maturation protein CcmE [Myxococcaceae]MBF5041086.1 cytochrome c maturation protein CcmE [Simulacricoccus sp. 17bor-14]MRI86873.1 cytochrome c maturation protein CcmE [Aggregicoccus sp. 17bor-14]